MERATAMPPLPRPQTTYRPHRVKPDFIVRVASKSGERMQVSIYRFMGRVRTADGQSARQLCRGLEHLFTKAAP